LAKNRTFPWHIIIKTASTENRERTLQAVREEKEMYNGKHIKITAEFTTETSKTRRAWSEVSWALNENNFQP
jgi:hypothetical protein